MKRRVVDPFQKLVLNPLVRAAFDDDDPRARQRTDRWSNLARGLCESASEMMGTDFLGSASTCMLRRRNGSERSEAPSPEVGL